jgi:hypothetical protein
LEVVLWNDLKHRLPTNFKILLVATVLHQGLIILDLSFILPRTKTQQVHKMTPPNVKDTMAKLAPTKALKAISQVCQNLFRFMADTPEINLSNGFWQMIVAEDSKWNFCNVMPDPEGTVQ